MSIVKTNAMRILDALKIRYETSSYEYDESDLSGVHAAAMLGISPQIMFKTLVTRGEGGFVGVFCIPVDGELDLKRCAAAAGQKKLVMAAVRELLPLTGYMRGGCSPIGMKKKYPTWIDESAVLLDEIYVSAGRRGEQVILAPDLLIKATSAIAVKLTREAE